MAVLSTLRYPNAQQFHKYALFYSTHRSYFQKAMNIAFALYFVSTFYRGVSSGPSANRKRRDKGDASKHPGEQPKVAVSVFYSLWGKSHIRRLQVDAVFYARLSAILRIVIPSLRSKEALLLAMHSGLLIFRTAISLYVDALDGKYVMTNRTASLQHLFHVSELLHH